MKITLNANFNKNVMLIVLTVMAQKYFIANTV